MNELDQKLLFYIFGGDIDFSRNISSPLHEDSTPSFRLYENEDKITWYDFALGQSGDLISLLGKMLGVNYFRAKLAAKNIIDKQVDVNSIEFKKFSPKPKTPYPQIEKRKQLKPYEIKWLENHQISKKVFEHYQKYYDLCFVRKVVWQNRKTPLYSKKDDIILHWQDDVRQSYKLYRPLRTSQKGKWSSGVVDHPLMGLETLKRAKKCLIVSSLKDQMVVDSALNQRYGIVSPFGSESNVNCWLRAKDKFQNLSPLVMFDADFTGWCKSVEIANIIGGTPIPLICYFIDIFGDKYKDFAEIAFNEDQNKLTKLLSWVAQDISREKCRYEETSVYKILTLIAIEMLKLKKNRAKSVKIPFEICESERSELSLRKIIIEQREQDSFLILQKTKK